MGDRARAISAVLDGGPSAVGDRVDGSELSFCAWSGDGLGQGGPGGGDVCEASRTAVAAGELGVARRGVTLRSSLVELLAAADVDGRAGDRGVGHEVDGQGGYIGWADDTSDRQSRAQLLAARVELVAEE